MRDSADHLPKGQKANIPEPALLSQGGLAAVHAVIHEEENEDSWPADEPRKTPNPEDTLEPDDLY